MSGAVEEMLRLAWVTLDFVPQPVDALMENFAGILVAWAPDDVKQVGRADDMAKMARQFVEETVLNVGQDDFFIAPEDPLAAAIDGEFPRADDGGNHRLAVDRTAPEVGPNTRQQLVDAERLGHVVVGAGIQSGDDILLLGARRQHPDRDGGKAADQPAEVKPRTL